MLKYCAKVLASKFDVFRSLSRYGAGLVEYHVGRWCFFVCSTHDIDLKAVILYILLQVAFLTARWP